MGETPALKKALSQRQLRMIAIGGVIGAGLFVGSGVVIGKTGPGVFITYALAGVLIIMVMRMLAEMAVANPSTGSFADYARNAMGARRPCGQSFPGRGHAGQASAARHHRLRLCGAGRGIRARLARGGGDIRRCTTMHGHRQE